MGVVGSVDELFKLGEAVGLSQGKDQLRLYIRLTGLFTSHLQKLHQVLPVPCTQSSSIRHKNFMGRNATIQVRLTGFTALGRCLSHFHVSRGVVGLDVGVDGFFDEALLELGFGQLTPHWRLVAALSKLIGSVQVTDVLDENLDRNVPEVDKAASG